MKRIITKALVLSALCVLLVSGTAVAKTLKIGTLSPITGPYAADGNDIMNGAVIAAEVFQKKGLLKGFDKIEVVSEDSACDPRQAVAAANKLLSQGVAFVDGAYCSGATIPASEVLNEGPIPMITPASTNPNVTLRGLKYMWRMCGIDAHQSKAGVDFMAKVLKAKTVFILDDKTTYSQHLAEYVAEAAKAAGIQVLAHDHVNEGDMDYSAVLTKIKAANPDVFYMSLQNSAAGIPFIKQLRQAGVKAQILSQDAVYHPQFIEKAQDAAQGVYFTFGFIDDTTEMYKDFLKAYTDKVGGKPGGYAFYSFDATWTMLTAISKAGSTDPEKIRAEMMKMDMAGVTKRIKFDANGDSGSNYIIQVVKGDKFVNYYDPSTGKFF
ncbi:MAG: branched-chain amino acid ABC transporter substrate-binding protein [Thermodesulfobacteriota bacterium]